MAPIMIPAKNNTGATNHCLDLIAGLDCSCRHGSSPPLAGMGRFAARVCASPISGGGPARMKIDIAPAVAGSGAFSRSVWGLQENAGEFPGSTTGTGGFGLASLAYCRMVLCAMTNAYTL